MTNEELLDKFRDTLPGFERADGWRSDCPKCVASKFACDEHRKPDAPPAAVLRGSQ